MYGIIADWQSNRFLPYFNGIRFQTSRCNMLPNPDTAMLRAMRADHPRERDLARIRALADQQAENQRNAGSGNVLARLLKIVRTLVKNKAPRISP